MNTPTPQQIIEVKAGALFDAWKLRNNFSGYTILGVETEFVFPLINPETESPSRTFSEAGKMDVLAKDEQGRVWVIEHKTTSESLAPDSDYWTRLRMDSQCSKYFLAAMMQKHDVAGVIYNVARRPLHQLRQIPMLDAEGFKQVFDASNQRVMCANGKKPRETADAEKGYTLLTRTETLDEFYERIRADIVERADEYFGRREVPRLSTDLIEYMSDAWSASQQILYFRSRGLWPRNTEACSAFGVCEFFDLCSGRASVDGIAYAKATTVHRELAAQSDGSKELFTNSRLRALRKCSRFHQLRYEDKIQKCGDEPETLAFGTVMHRLWEGYFKSLQTK